MNQSSLIPVATLGTHQAGTLPPPPAECLAKQWDNIDTSDLPAAILKAAALENTYHCTGTIPLELNPPGDTAPPEDTGADHSVSEPAMDAALRMITGENHEYLSEWLQLASGSAKRAPYRILPQLLDHGTSHPQYRRMIGTIVGTRGVWLASRYPEWQWLSDSTQDTSIPAEQLWETGTDAQRLSSIKQLNNQDAGAAAEKIHHSWKSESPSFKLSLIKNTPYHHDHEPWLTLAICDPRKEIRELATSTLLAFPSDYRHRSLERARPFVSFQKRKLTLTLPETFDSAWANDGIKAKPPGKPIGEKAGWLQQILTRIPLDDWPSLTRQNKPVWKLTPHQDWEQLISGSLHAAAQNTGHAETLAGYTLHLAKTKSPHPLLPIVSRLTAMSDANGTPEIIDSLIGKTDNTALLNHIISHPSRFLKAKRTAPFILKQISTSNSDKPPYFTRPQARKLALAISITEIEPTLRKISKFNKLNTPTEEFANQLEFRLSYIKSLTSQI